MAHDLKSVSLRHFNAAGADPACETGGDHNLETHFFFWCLILQQVSANQLLSSPMTITPGIENEFAITYM